MKEKMYMIQVIIAEGCIEKNFFGQEDFCPDKPRDEWKTYSFIGPDVISGAKEIASRIEHDYDDCAG
jgi:hypothetical protein